MTDRDRRKLQGCAVELIAKVNRVLDRMADHGQLMMVTDGARTTSEQVAKWAIGRTQPGRKVTYADGVKVKSNHQSGRAADCCFVVNGQPSWDLELPWELYGETAEAEGLHWGGRFMHQDFPHVELAPEQTDTLNA